MSPTTQPRKITFSGHRLRRYAQTLYNLHLRLNPPPTPTQTPARPQPSSSSTVQQHQIRIVCISDTHNNQPSLPVGDILIHAGDLTETGSFDELQDQITWLDAQPFRHIVVIAGNHDVLLDEGFLEKFPERRYGELRTKRELAWGRVRYLENESVSLEVTLDSKDSTTVNSKKTDSSNSTVPGTRKLEIFGTPLTPQYGVSAFQYPSHLSEGVWENKIPDDTDILIVHGPPRLHLDFDPNIQGGSLRHPGDAYLTSEIGRVRPRLVIFGHIHVGYGREDLVLDSVRRGFEGIQNRLGGWGMLGLMCLGVVWEVIRRVIGSKDKKVTTFVNAAVVGGFLANGLKNEAFIVDI
ncbi:Metallo-dependent phosphatase-like protein [Aspergillus filifer]